MRSGCSPGSSESRLRANRFSAARAGASDEPGAACLAAIFPISWGYPSDVLRVSDGMRQRADCRRAERSSEEARDVERMYAVWGTKPFAGGHVLWLQYGRLRFLPPRAESKPLAVGKPHGGDGMSAVWGNADADAGPRLSNRANSAQEKVVAVLEIGLA